MEWEVKMTACRSFVKFLTQSHKNRLVAGSIPAVGSSRKMTLGAPMMAMATQSFRLLPPE